MDRVQQTPAELGYRMPAEWETQTATWLTWPEDPEAWLADLDQVRVTFARFIAEIAAVQRVHLFVKDEPTAEEVRRLVTRQRGNVAALTCHVVPTNLCWMRDCGPTFLVRDAADTNPLALVGWKYNAWGGKYPPWEDDAAIPGRIARMLDLPLFEPGIVLEGGSIEVNGRGTLLTTEQCLLNPNRNPDLSRAEIEKYLCDYLGQKKILWLIEGVEGDDTDGHIDDLARFVATDTVVTVLEDDPNDFNYLPVRENFRILQSAEDAMGHALRVVTLPMPPRVEFQGQRMPASYANFYICNGKLIVPTFGGPNDSIALTVLSKLFPGHKVVGLRANELVSGFGAFHCVSQQQPATDVDL